MSLLRPGEGVGGKEEGRGKKGGGYNLHSQGKKKKGTKSNTLLSHLFSVEQKPERILGARLEMSLKHLKSDKDRVSR